MFSEEIMMARTTGPSTRPRLLDVLEQLPRDVLRENVWLYLGNSPHDSDRPSTTLGRALRLSCRRSLTLADELTQRLHLELSKEASLCSKPSTSAASGFISRQEGLRELSLDGWEQSIIETLHMVDPMGQQLRGLRLPDASCCTSAAGHAVQHCCPNISSLELDGNWLDAAFLVPLRDLRSLTKVTFAGFSQDSWHADSSAMVRALATLPRLVQLAFNNFCGTVTPADVAPLSTLTDLEDLYLGGLEVNMAATDGPPLGSALGSLTRLTALEFPQWQSVTNEEPDYLPHVIDAVMAHLGGLQRLAFLSDTSDASSWITVECGCPALCQLSALTKLVFPGMQPQAHLGAGHLPHLRHLQLTGSMDVRVLGDTLRPLWPLPQLQQVTFGVDLALPWDDADGGDSNAVGRATDVMWSAATLLRQAPRLERVDVTLGLYMRQALPPLMGVAVAVLVPLRDMLTDLSLQNLPAGSLEALWPLLCLAGRLHTLSLSSCELSESGLAAVGQHLVAVRHLNVYAHRDTPEVTGHWALALAAARVQPLQVFWSPLLSTEWRQRFQAAAAAGGAVLVDLPRRGL